jgi:hypothetical protein
MATWSLKQLQEALFTWEGMEAAKALKGPAIEPLLRELSRIVQDSYFPPAGPLDDAVAISRYPGSGDGQKPKDRTLTSYVVEHLLQHDERLRNFALKLHEKGKPGALEQTNRRFLALLVLLEHLEGDENGLQEAYDLLCKNAQPLTGLLYSERQRGFAKRPRQRAGGRQREKERWQCEARKVWQSNPGLSACRVAGLIKRRLALPDSVETIRKAIGAAARADKKLAC